MQVVNSKYALVILTAKRARYMIDNNPDLVDDETFNPVSAAFDEVVSGALHWTNSPLPAPADGETAEEH